MRWLHVNHNEDGFSFEGAGGGGIADGKFILSTSRFVFVDLILSCSSLTRLIEIKNFY